MTGRRWQPYKGTAAWLAQRISAIGLTVLVPLKIYSGYAATGKLPWFGAGSSLAVHINGFIDSALLLFVLVHVLYGLRVILIDVGFIREDRWFWETAGLALAVFVVAVVYLYWL